MPHNRFYLDASLQDTLILSGDEFHHLSVLRAHPGDEIEIVNGKGQIATARVSSMKKREAELEVLQVKTSPPSPPLILAQALPRMNHLEWIIEKGTELGVTSFWLFPGLLSEKKELSESQAARLKSLAVAAMKQCGRLDLPMIETKPPLQQWKSIQGTPLFGSLNENDSYLWELPRSLDSPIVLFIGPESGLDPREEAILKSLNAKGIRLHTNTLRTETAAISALSLIQIYQIKLN